MRFTKFFRRYSRTLLMVFMSLLLVVFLLGDVLQSMTRTPGSQKMLIGRSMYGDVYDADVGETQADQQVLAQLGFSEAGMFEPLELRLLMQEAQRMGVSVGREEVRATLAQMGRPADQVQQLLANLQRYSHRSTDGIYDLIGRWLAVRNVWQMQEEALEESAPRTEMAYRDANQKADVQLSVIDSRAFVSRVAEPTEEELQAFFEANKERFPGHTDDELAFGYRLPDRVRIEYLTIDPKSLEPKIHARERELEKFFQENSRNYTKTVAAEDPTATRPTQTTVAMTFEEAKDKVRQDYLRARAIHEAQLLMNQIHSSVYRPWQMQRPDERGFRPEPSDAPVSFEELRNQFADRAEITYQQTPLMSQEELQNFFDDRPELVKQMGDQFGSPEPMYVEGENRLPISALAFRVKGLYAPKANERLPVLNVLEPSPVINTQHSAAGPMQRRGRGPETPYQPYMFRVVQAEPAAPPAALEQVREQVRSDYKLMKAHALAGEFAEQLAEGARAAGLTAAAEQATELKQILSAAEPPDVLLSQNPAAGQTPYTKEFGPVAPPEPVTRRSEAIGQYLPDSNKLPREVFEALDKAAPESSPARTVVADDVAKLFKWAVVEVGGVQPIYRGQFEQQRARLQRSGAGRVAQEVARGWFDPENIRMRNGFTSLMPADTQPASD